MNKKLLFAAMSLVAFTACTNNDFESQQIAEEVGSVQFEVLNSNDAFTRASMGGTNNNTIEWSVADGDLFTLYHGAAVGATKGYENAIYMATPVEGEPATLSTPTMIKDGGAIMVWPVDSEFNIKPATDLFIKIPANQSAKIQNEIPYVSDLITIAERTTGKAVYNVAGYERKYPLYMRPMASQLNIKADYAETDGDLKKLETSDGIAPIEVTSVDLLTNDGGKTEFTTKIPVKFNDPTKDIEKQWNNSKTNRAWTKVTTLDATAVIEKTAKLSTKFLNGNDGCKFLILPQENIGDGDGVEAAAVVVNTNYGKVVVAKPGVPGTKYTAEEAGDAWYRYITKVADRDGKENVTEFKNDKGQTKVTAEVAQGLKQTINFFSTKVNDKDGSVVKGEPQGTAVTRYVKVLLTHLDMDGLHLDTDKKLRDAAIVWMKMGLANATIWLDGTKGKFEISQNTIKTINEINAAAAKEDTPRHLYVTPCNLAGEKCETIVITGASEIQNIQDMTFITNTSTQQADVALKAGETWKWNGKTDKVKQIQVGTGVKSIINKGTLESTGTATLAIFDATPTQIYTVPFKNEGTWTISGGDLNVQFDVTNIGTVTIADGAEYHQDGTGNVFTNDAETKEQRFLDKGNQKIGVINNSGVLGSVNGGNINNYGLIEHLLKSAKTYVTTNEFAGSNFSAVFDKAKKQDG